MTAVLMVTSALLFAGQVSDDFVKAARAAYAKDDGCRKSIVYEHSGRHVRDDSRPADGVADDKNPGRIVKWIDVDGARNVRDIGGWTGLRTGRVFRGTELGEVKTKDGNSHGYQLTPAGIKTMREQMGINTDFDLRAVTTASRGKYVTESAIGKDIRLLDHPIGSYMDAFTYKGEKDYGAALREFARPEIYPVYIHCAGGADRTGTLCFLLETLCGVSLADARAEFELTSFSPVGLRTSNRESVQPFATLVRTLSTYPGATFQDKVAYWAEKVARLTPAEIAAIRANLCEMKGSASSASDDAGFRDDPAKYWDVAALKKTPGFRPNPFPDSDTPDMRSFLVKGKGPNDSEAEFFCTYALPETPRPPKGYPCVLLVHGGGGTAFPNYIDHWRKSGFAVLAPDWYNQRPVTTGTAKGEHDYARAPLPGGRRNDQRANIANLVLANSLLRSMPEVDPARNVYVGLSWGSWYGAAIAGIDDRYAGVVEIYCGDAKKTNRDWLVNGRFLHRATMPVWWTTWTQDSNVTPQTSQAGWDECPTYWGHVTCPTLGHSHYGFLLDSVMRMAKHFAGMGPALPRLGRAELKGGVLAAPVEGLGRKTGTAFLVYTADAENMLKPAKRIWKHVPATLEGKTVSAKLPEGALIAFLTLNEEDDKPSSVGGSSSFWFAE